NSLGAFYEEHLLSFHSYINLNQTLVSDPGKFAGEVARIVSLFPVTLPSPNIAQVLSIFYSSKLAEILPPDLAALVYADFENRYQDLLAIARYFRSQPVAGVSANSAP